MDFDFLKNILVIAITSGTITTLLVQKIKEGIDITDSKIVLLISFIVSILLGRLFAISFADLDIINALWVGLFSFIGADIIYNTLKDKVFDSLTKINEDKENIIER